MDRQNALVQLIRHLNGFDAYLFIQETLLERFGM